jgi:hypothetical protein
LARREFGVYTSQTAKTFLTVGQVISFVAVSVDIASTAKEGFSRSAAPRRAARVSKKF